MAKKRLPAVKDDTPAHPLEEGKFNPAANELYADPLPAVLPGPASLAHLKGASLRNVGKDKDGKTIPHKRTDTIAALISRMVACGASESEIAVYLNIRPGLLRQCYAMELDNGAFPHNMTIAGAIMDRAKKGDLNAGIYWTKARMKWRDGDSKETANMNAFAVHIHV